jgi:hypothetical protein
VIGTSEVVELDLTFRAVDAGASVHHEVPDIFAASWPAYRAWFLREGERARPSYATGAFQLRQHMPELVDTYEQLVGAVGGGDLEARFLSHWCPPPLLTACSLAVWDRDRHLLVRSYDYPPLLCDTTVLATTWAGTRVMAMSDCVWGAVDGVNDHGLAVAIAFGGRPVVGTGFGIGLVVRYVLQVARDVREAELAGGKIDQKIATNVRIVHGLQPLRERQFGLSKALRVNHLYRHLMSQEKDSSLQTIGRPRLIRTANQFLITRTLHRPMSSFSTRGGFVRAVIGDVVPPGPAVLLVLERLQGGVDVLHHVDGKHVRGRAVQGEPRDALDRVELDELEALVARLGVDVDVVRGRHRHHGLELPRQVIELGVAHELPVHLRHTRVIIDVLI